MNPEELQAKSEQERRQMFADNDAENNKTHRKNVLIPSWYFEFKRKL